MTLTFDHPALLYDGLDEYTSAVGAYVRSAVTSGDAVMVAVPEVNLTPLRDTLTDVRAEVVFADMTVAGRNPGHIIPGVLLAFAARHPGRHISIVGEPIWPSRSAIEYPACATHEALINAVFAGRDASILCPYDVTGLGQDALADAWRTHPVMITRDGRRPSPSYADPIETADRFNEPLPPVPPEAEIFPYATAQDLSRVRAFVADRACKAGLPEQRIDDAVTAVNELAENSILHADGVRSIALWPEADCLIVQADDHGTFADPLAGRVPPPLNVPGGRGLVLVNHLCDLVRVHRRPDGTSIRVHLHGLQL